MTSCTREISTPNRQQILTEKFYYFRRFAWETSPGNFSLNFKDPGALRTLTCALLEQDFGLKLNIPLDRLIPTVPLRLNYLKSFKCYDWLPGD